MMKNLLSGIVLVAMVVLHAAAVDMSLYSPTKDVDAEFQTFLKECVLLLLRTSLTHHHPTNLLPPPPPQKDASHIFRVLQKPASDTSPRLYAETEDPASTTTFTDFFAPEGSLKVLQYSAVGAEKITGLKQALMPTTGKKLWHHLPNVTTVSAEDDTMRTYTVLGVIQTTHEGVNCSQAQ